MSDNHRYVANSDLDKVIDDLNQTMNFSLTIDNYRIFSLFELKNYHCPIVPSLTISIYLENTINNTKIKINHLTYYEYSTPIVNYTLTDFYKHQISEFLHRQETEAKVFIRYIYPSNY